MDSKKEEKEKFEKGEQFRISRKPFGYYINYPLVWRKRNRHRRGKRKNNRGKMRRKKNRYFFNDSW